MTKTNKEIRGWKEIIIEIEEGELNIDITHDNYIAKDGYNIRLVPCEDEKFASEISEFCGICTKQDAVECGDCASNITKWMTQEYVPPKKELSETDIVKEFENVFQDRRAISLDEIKSTIRGLFE